MDAAKLYKIQWKERVQTAGQISNLPDDFYPKLRRCLAELKEEAVKPQKKYGNMKEHALDARHREFKIKEDYFFCLGSTSNRTNTEESHRRRKVSLRATLQTYYMIGGTQILECEENRRMTEELETIDPQERFQELFKTEKYRQRISQMAVSR